jgi:hypothetical protein
LNLEFGIWNLETTGPLLPLQMLLDGASEYLMSLSMKDKLKCSLCQKLFVEPVYLNCGHLFCRLYYHFMILKVFPIDISLDLAFYHHLKQLRFVLSVKVMFLQEILQSPHL